MVFPHDPEGFAIDDQFYIGSSGLLVKPITTQGATSTDVYLSDSQIYYNYFTSHAYPAVAKNAPHGRRVTVPAELHEIPLLIRGGSIVPTRERPRRSSGLMRKDPFTLRVALDVDGAASGRMYLDEGEGYGHTNGEFVWRVFGAEMQKKKSRQLRIWNNNRANPGVALYDPTNAFAQTVSGIRVERVIVIGVGARPAAVTIVGGPEVEWEWEEGTGFGATAEGRAGVLVLRDPGVGIADDWEIVASFS